MKLTFTTHHLETATKVVAPDGSDVRILGQVSRGSMAHFTLDPGSISKAVAHKTVEELWFFVAGRGRMWRRCDGQEEIVDVSPGVSLTIPVGTHFQFRSDGNEPLEAVGVTMPSWPGEDEAYFVTGKW